MSDTAWIGVDLDGTLAVYDEWRGPEHIGEPIPLMVQRVRGWLIGGYSVKIFTARVSSGNPDRVKSLEAIRKWSLRVFGVAIPATAEKDYGMIELWDDRCRRVEPNTGIEIGATP